MERSFVFSSKRFLSARNGTEATTNGLHEASNTRVGEGVPLQPVPDKTTSNRDRAHASAIGTTDQDLVPEPAHEMEEGQQTAQHEKRPTEKRQRTDATQGVQVQLPFGQQQQPTKKQQQLAIQWFGKQSRFQRWLRPGGRPGDECNNVTTFSRSPFGIPEPRSSPGAPSGSVESSSWNDGFWNGSLRSYEFREYQSPGTFDQQSTRAVFVGCTTSVYKI